MGKSEFTDAEIDAVFKGTNFGTPFGTHDKRRIMAECILNRLTGYHSGGTITGICNHLGLLTKRNNPTKSGKWFALCFFTPPGGPK